MPGDLFYYFFFIFFVPKWMPASYLEAVALLSFVCLFETSIYILDKAVHNFCGKSNVYLKVIFTFHLHHPKQTMDSHAKTVTERADTPRLIFPRELTSPSPLVVAFQSWVGAHTGQVWAHSVSAGRWQTPSKTRGVSWASRWPMARHKPCFYSPCSCFSVT